VAHALDKGGNQIGAEEREEGGAAAKWRGKSSKLKVKSSKLEEQDTARSGIVDQMGKRVKRAGRRSGE
jgi:hypothetical protein